MYNNKKGKAFDTEAQGPVHPTQNKGKAFNVEAQVPCPPNPSS